MRKSYSMTQGKRNYDYPGQKEEIQQDHKHNLKCIKNRKKRKSKNK